MLRCREVTRIIASGEIERAGWARRLSIHMHLLMCPNCNRYAAQVKALGTSIRRLFASSPEENERLRRLEQEILEAAFGDGGGRAAPS